MSVMRLWSSLFEIGVDISTKNYRTGSRKRLVSPRKLSRLHIIFEHTDTCLGILKSGVSDFIEKDNVLKADDTKFPRGFVVEQGRRSGLPTGHDESPARSITERVSLSCLTWAKLD